MKHNVEVGYDVSVRQLRTLFTYWCHVCLRQTVLEEPPKLYGTPKIHKNNTPLRPIASSCCSITYNAAQYLASILTPLVGKNCHSINNTKELVDKLRGLEIPPARKLVSYDVTASLVSLWIRHWKPSQRDYKNMTP